MPWEIIAQVCGVVAMIVAIGSFQGKSSGRILAWQVTANCLWCVHFFLLNSYTGAILNVLSGVRNATYYYLGKKKSDKTLHASIFFCAITFVVSLLTYQNWLSILPMIGTAVQSFSFAAKRANRVRLFTLLGSPFWLVYDVLSGSYSGVIAEGIASVSMIVGLIRFRHQDDADAQTQEGENGVEA